MPSTAARCCLTALAAATIAGCGGGSTTTTSTAHRAAAHAAPGHRPTTVGKPKPRPKPKPVLPRVLAAATASAPTGFVPAVTLAGWPAAWVARSAAGVGLISFDPAHTTLALHSGTVDAGGSGWRYGPAITGAERRRVVAAFNGGFKLSTGAGGFMSGGRTAVRLRAGLGSIVTYSDGTSDIGAWHREVPAPGRPVVSVRQNLTLLIDHGRAASSTGCQLCWGATLGGVPDPARSALGITADGHLIWAGGEHLTAGALAAALLQARVVRAVELDINPEWVAALPVRPPRRARVAHADPGRTRPARGPGLLPGAVQPGLLRGPDPLSA